MSEPRLTQRSLRHLPAVDALADRIREDLLPGSSHREAVSISRSALDAVRAELLATGHVDVEAALDRAVKDRTRPVSRRVINATGVILHTNLGRAPLSHHAVNAIVDIASSYSDLEIDLRSGERSRRGDRVEKLLTETVGSERSLVVNNCAAAVLLAVTALAGTTKSVIVSRGELVEIGGGFRIPDVVSACGSQIVEVGTTNRTRLSDYVQAIERESGECVILRVHKSNFRTIGFTESVPIDELCGLGVPVIDDIGSGALAPFNDGVIDELFVDEPMVSRSLHAGSAVVCFSADKLLGGPQAGVMAGRAEPIEMCAGHELARALRACKLTHSALEATLELFRDPARATNQVPVLRMMQIPHEELLDRAEKIANCVGGDVVDRAAPIGGGSLPTRDLKGPVVRLRRTRTGATEFAARLRMGSTPVLARIEHERVILDPRTVLADEIDDLLAAVLDADITMAVR